MVIFYKKFKKYNKIQLTKNKMDLTIEKSKILTILTRSIKMTKLMISVNCVHSKLSAK